MKSYRRATSVWQWLGLVVGMALGWQIGGFGFAVIGAFLGWLGASVLTTRS